jgi:hypothetical protein
MLKKNIVISISFLSILMFTLFIYPSFNQSVNAKQSNFNTISLDNAYRINAESDVVINRYFGKAVVEKILQQPG